MVRTVTGAEVVATPWEVEVLAVVTATTELVVGTTTALEVLA